MQPRRAPMFTAFFSVDEPACGRKGRALEVRTYLLWSKRELQDGEDWMCRPSYHGQGLVGARECSAVELKDPLQVAERGNSR